MSVKIIAEAGVNHNGDIYLAKDLVDAAVAVGADAIKFQSFKAEALVTSKAKQAKYQIRNSRNNRSQLNMLQGLELSFDDQREIFEHCKSKNIEFLSSAFDHQSLDFLINELKLSSLKIPSGELTNGPFLLAHAISGRNLIISTGMATIPEIVEALKVVAFGCAYPESKEFDVSIFNKKYRDIEGLEYLEHRVNLLHCTSEYPVQPHEINLNAMQFMATEFGLQVGYSDHSEGQNVAIAAVAMGAKIIEKHFTLSRFMAGPDHLASMEPHEFAIMVKGIREVSSALGQHKKKPQKSELKNKRLVRKSVIAARDIKAGTKITPADLVIKRPLGGLRPNDYWASIGKYAEQDYKQGDFFLG